MTERIMEIICEIKSKVKRMSWEYGMCVCVCVRADTGGERRLKGHLVCASTKMK